jgi:hypothetical protein
MKVMGLDWLSYAPSASCRTTISYLTLPYTRITQHLHARDVVTDDFQEAFTNMSQIVDPTSLTLSKEQKSRFTRAMRVLDLQPFVHFMQAFNLGNYIQSSPKLKAINCPATINTMSETEKAQLKEGVSSLIGGKSLSRSFGYHL